MNTFFCISSFSLHDQGHVLLVRQSRLLPQPEAVVDSKGVDCHRQMLRVDLGELFPARVILEKVLEHLIGDLFGARAVDLVDLFGVGVVGVEASELALLIPEQQKEVRTVAAIDDVEDAFAGVAVHFAGEHDELDGVEDDVAVGFGGRFAVKSRSRSVAVSRKSGRGRDVGSAVVVFALAGAASPISGQRSGP